MPAMLRPFGRATEIANALLAPHRDSNMISNQSMDNYSYANSLVPTLASNDAMPEYAAYAKEQQNYVRYMR